MEIRNKGVLGLSHTHRQEGKGTGMSELQVADYTTGRVAQ